MSLETRLPLILALFMVATLSVFLGSCSNEKKAETGGKRVYDFLANAQSAKITASSPELVKFGLELTIENDKRLVLFEHPSAEVIFDNVLIPKNSVVQFGIGINQAAWDKSGDGVTFELTIVDEKSDKTIIFSEYIDPKKNSRERKWFDQSLDLKAFAGQKATFIFKTSPGPRNDRDYDWSGWSNPQITAPG
jgi:hypothetical protein